MKKRLLIVLSIILSVNSLFAQFVSCDTSYKVPYSPLLQKINGPILLLGGKEDIEVAQKILKALPNVSIQSQVGKCSIHESAWLVQNAAQLLNQAFPNTTIQLLHNAPINR